MTKIIHYRDNCIGCNSCVESAPEHWFIDEDGKSTLRDGKFNKKNYVKKIEEFDRESNEEAAKNCPVSIIKVID